MKFTKKLHAQAVRSGDAAWYSSYNEAAREQFDKVQNALTVRAEQLASLQKQADADPEVSLKHKHELVRLAEYLAHYTWEIIQHLEYLLNRDRHDSRIKFKKQGRALLKLAYKISSITSEVITKS
jgi:hypothetical protein